MTDQLSRQTSSGDQLALIAHFLDELDLKTPIRPLAKETDSNTALLDTINSLVAVGAFIAGVQAQIIGLANTNDGNFLGHATSWFAFVGLTLDLIGAISGVARALLLQAAIRRSHRLVVRLTGQIDGARHQVRELQRRGVDLSDDERARAFLTRSVRAISRIVGLLAEDERFGVQSAGNITEIEAAGEAALDALGSLQNSSARENRHLFHKLWLAKFVLPHAHVEGLGNIPVLSLAGGALCLLMSVMLYAGNSHPRGIWISCSTIFVCMITFAMYPSTNPHKRKRAILYNRVDEELQHCPRVQPPVYSGSVPHWHEKELTA